VGDARSHNMSLEIIGKKKRKSTISKRPVDVSWIDAAPLPLLLLEATFPKSASVIPKLPAYTSSQVTSKITFTTITTPGMALDCSLIRNVFFHDATNPDVTLGGFFQNGSITEANFLDFLEIVLANLVVIRVKKRTSTRIVSRINVPLEAGAYDIYSDGIKRL